MSGTLAVAIGASAGVILAAPFVGDVRAAIQAAFPGSYRQVVLAIVAAAVLLATIGAAVRIRDRRAARYGLLATALVVALAYARATSSGNPEVDAVEYFHFVEYGVLAVLHHRAWRGSDRVAAFAMPAIAGLLVGTLDEWVQWFVPFRVGELRDVLLNGVAVSCGLLFAAALHPPARRAPERPPRAALARLALAAVLVLAAFIHTVHVGHEVRLEPSTTFVSRFSAPALLDASRARTLAWVDGLPAERRISREDHYLSEGRWHIEERNEAVSARDFRTAWHEQRILDAYFAPVLLALPDVRWPDEQRADIASQVAEDVAFSSQAHPHPIYPWNPVLFWAVVAPVAGALGWIARARRPARLRVRQPA